MNLSLKNAIKLYLVADMPQLSFKERAKSALGTAAGVAIVFCLTYFLSDHHWMLAAVGATAIILFSMPHSPMAQPWSVLGGYFISAVVALIVSMIVVNPIVGTGISVALVVMLMLSFKCLHPPAGAIAVFVTTQKPSGTAAMIDMMASILLSSLLLLVAAGLINKLLGRRYPQCQSDQPKNLHRTDDQPPMARTGLAHEDLEYALKKHGTYVDVQENELVDLFDTAVSHAFSRKMNTLCGDIMARDVVSISEQDSIGVAWNLLHRHKIKALPVIDPERRIVGIVTIADFLKDVAAQGANYLSGLERLIRRDTSRKKSAERPVAQIMTRNVVTETIDTPVSVLIRKLSDGGMHHVPIVDSEQALVGMITQSDLIASMYQKIVLNSR